MGGGGTGGISMGGGSAWGFSGVAVALGASSWVAVALGLLRPLRRHWVLLQGGGGTGGTFAALL